LSSFSFFDVYYANYVVNKDEYISVTSTSSYQKQNMTLLCYNHLHR